MTNLNCAFHGIGSSPYGDASHCTCGQMPTQSIGKSVCGLGCGCLKCYIKERFPDRVPKEIPQASSMPCPQSRPHKCPVCDGEGEITVGFYTMNQQDIKCRSCLNGVVRG